MKLFIGRYWVPFPSSEYGGMWVVAAKDKAQCIELLEQDTEFGWEKHEHRIPDAVDKALQYDVVGDYTAGVIDMFTT
jgi:hypothetical protein